MGWVFEISKSSFFEMLFSIPFRKSIEKDNLYSEADTPNDPAIRAAAKIGSI